MTEIVGFCVAAVVLVGASLAVVLTPNLFHAVLWLAAALVATGGIFLLLADTLARSVAAPIQLPVGVITALIGVPVFLYLLGRGRR